MKQIDKRYKIKIIGAGPTGSLLALLLYKLGCSVTIYDPKNLDQLINQSRAYALSHSSQQIMTKKILRDKVVNLVLENFNNDTELILDSWFSDSGQKRLEFLYNKLNK